MDMFTRIFDKVFPPRYRITRRDVAYAMVIYDDGSFRYVYSDAELLRRRFAANVEDVLYKGEF